MKFIRLVTGRILILSLIIGGMRIAFTKAASAVDSRYSCLDLYSQLPMVPMRGSPSYRTSLIDLLDGSTLSRLTDSATTSHESPDGRYAVDLTDNAQLYLRLTPLDKKLLEPLFSRDGVWAWSPDCKWLTDGFSDVTSVESQVVIVDPIAKTKQVILEDSSNQYTAV